MKPDRGQRPEEQERKTARGLIVDLNSELPVAEYSPICSLQATACRSSPLGALARPLRSSEGTA